MGRVRPTICSLADGWPTAGEEEARSALAGRFASKAESRPRSPSPTPPRSTIWPDVPATGPARSAQRPVGVRRRTLTGSATALPKAVAQGELRRREVEQADPAGPDRPFTQFVADGEVSGPVGSSCRAVSSGPPLGRSSPATPPHARATARRVPRAVCALYAGSLSTSPARVSPTLDRPAAEREAAVAVR